MLQTKYVTLDEFKEYFGIDLSVELEDDANSSNKANAFLKRIEDRMETYLNSNFYRNVELEYPKFSDYQKKHYKRALLEQAIYVLKNGDISVDSGYDGDRGQIISKGNLKKLIIAENCKQELILCGLWCRKIKSRGFSFEGWWY